MSHFSADEVIVSQSYRWRTGGFWLIGRFCPFTVQYTIHILHDAWALILFQWHSCRCCCCCRNTMPTSPGDRRLRRLSLNLLQNFFRRSRDTPTVLLWIVSPLTRVRVLITTSMHSHNKRSYEWTSAWVNWPNLLCQQISCSETYWYLLSNYVSERLGTYYDRTTW